MRLWEPGLTSETVMHPESLHLPMRLLATKCSAAPLLMQVSSRCSSADSQRVAKTALCTAGKPSAAAADAAAIQVQSAPGRAAEEAVGKLSLGSTEQPTGNGIATAAAAASSAGEEKALRQQEVVDDDDEPAPASPAGGAGAALQRSHWQAAGRQQQPGGQGEDDDDEGLACKVVWDSSPAQAGAAARVPAADTDMAAFGGAGASILQLKEQGNICLKAGDFEGAVRCYSEALSACKQSRRAAQQAAPLQAAPQPAQQDQQGDPPSHQQHPAAEGQREATGHQLLATLHSNRAHALLRLKRNEEARGAGRARCSASWRWHQWQLLGELLQHTLHLVAACFLCSLLSSPSTLSLMPPSQSLHH